ncbi:HSP20-like chaperone [Arabidopsis thaliana x Arabidopsis arenosa]|uniref:HSP20-like chaperone n=1 Tax=Arabidopsis thaliana x Arabidopsis arenosa TaxID=1240361 RepID=A0A8T1Y658_9BRAS|nr:HSP20-like chaperone [Arabidopsis thaliana x Arabidopsis arenosa]
MVVPVTLDPPSPEGFYAINNPFLVNGPKGFLEAMTLEDESYIRFDLPGVPPDGVTVYLDPPNKAVCILADAPKEHKYDSSHRNYDGTRLRPKLNYRGINTKIPCTCCEFFSGFTSHMADGVLRLILTKHHTSTPRPPCISFLGGPDGEHTYGTAQSHHDFPHGTDPNDPNLTGPILIPHICVAQGSQMPYESKRLQNGGLYVRVDMPGVPSDNFTVSVTNGRVKVTGEAPALSHDSAGRFYSGDVAILSTPVDLPVRKIKTIAKNGVIRLVIPPL